MQADCLSQLFAEIKKDIYRRIGLKHPLIKKIFSSGLFNSAAYIKIIFACGLVKAAACKCWSLQTILSTPLICKDGDFTST